MTEELKGYAESLHSIPSVLKKGPPVDLFEDSNMTDFAKICKQLIVYGCIFVIFTQLEIG